MKAYKKHTPTLYGNWSLISDHNQLNIEYLRALKPKYIFFPHWSWIVPEEVLNEFTCICFHMTDLPYGRGGSPLQNLISRNHSETKITALKMTREIDAGDIYLKAPLLLQGSAQEIYECSAEIIFEMIKSIITLEPTPIKQAGAVVKFSRRTPEQSEIMGDEHLQDLYDLIRMMDAETYPKAFIIKKDLKLTLDHAELLEGTLTAKVTFSRHSKNQNK